MKKTILVLALFLLFSECLQAQVFFKTELRQNNPASKDSAFSISKRLQLHKTYLQKAIAEKNIKHQLFGYLYLYNDYKNSSDYINLNDVMIQAEILVRKSKNLTWHGQVALYRGAIYELNDQPKEELEQYKLALQYCIASKDSICIAESLEQLSAIYGKKHDFEKAHAYFNKALSIFKKYQIQRSIAIAYANFSNTLSYQKKYVLAEKYNDSSLAIAINSKDSYNEMMQIQNKAAIYIDMAAYDKALTIYNNNNGIIKKYKWKDRELNNEYGLYYTYEKKADYRQALDHFYKYTFLNDSLNGANVKTKIATLETQYKNQKRAFDFKKNKLHLAIANQKIERYAWIIFTISVFVILGLFLWRRQTTRNKSERNLRHQDLAGLTKLLIEKNSLLLQYETELSYLNATSINSEYFEAELYNQRILTDDDWAAFKSYFEKVYPGFIKNVRDTYPSITQAEERLFLCLKINLKNKETASMLGISNDSVKKNRNRLRKRLKLTEKEDLEVFIMNFNKIN